MDQMIGIMARHLGPAFDMIEGVINACPEPLWNAKTRQAPVWLHLYHALASVDFWFRASKDEPFDYPTFGKAVDPDLAKTSADFLTKAELGGHLKRVREKAEAYAAAAEREGLSTPSPITDVYTKADIFLGQIRHLQHHIGFCNATISSGGASPAAWMGYGE